MDVVAGGYKLNVNKLIVFLTIPRRVEPSQKKAGGWSFGQSIRIKLILPSKNEDEDGYFL